MENFMKTEEYKKMKLIEEKKIFKIIGKYVFIHNDGRLEEKKPSDIKEYYKNKKITIKEEKENGNLTIIKSKTKSFYEIWSQDENMREYEQIVFNCNLKNVLPTQYNLFKGFIHLNDVENYKNYDLSDVFEHFKSLVNYDKTNYNYLMSFLAHIIQKPHEIPGTCLVFISEEGVGKDLWYEFLENVIGNQYCGITEKLELICGKFNTEIAGKLLYAINETNPVESRQRAENIKSLVTAKKVIIEGKYKDPITCDNFCRNIFFSNRLFAFPIESGSRRPVIFQPSTKYLKMNYGTDKSKKHFDNLSNHFKNRDCQRAMLEYLINYDISMWNPKVFNKSKLHSELENASIPVIATFLHSYFYDIKDKTYTVKFSNLFAAFDDYLKQNKYEYNITSTKMGLELKMNYYGTANECGDRKYTFDIDSLKKDFNERYKLQFKYMNTNNFIVNKKQNEENIKKLKCIFKENKRRFDIQNKHFNEQSEKYNDMISKYKQINNHEKLLSDDIDVWEIPTF